MRSSYKQLLLDCFSDQEVTQHDILFQMFLKYEDVFYVFCLQNKASSEAHVKLLNSLCLLCFSDQDLENKRAGSPLKQQGPAAENLSQAEILLKDLFMDVSKAKKLQHPQASEIELEWVNKHKHATHTSQRAALTLSSEMCV